MPRVGDIITIKRDLSYQTDYGPLLCAIRAMEQYRGMRARILTNSCGTYRICVDKGRRQWVDQMFEK